MASKPFPLIGVELLYSDGKSVLFGSNNGCEISFFVNGPDGERITQVGILEHNERHYSAVGPGGLQVSTNYRRIATFAPLVSRLYTSVEPIQILPPGNTITRFVALENAIKTHFTRIGIQSQQCDKPMIPNILNHGCHQTPGDQLKYDEQFTRLVSNSSSGTYQTYASLKNVRKIQASMGISGRSRSPNHISGLKIKYYDHPSPSVVGQWMNELYDGFELSLDKKVQSLTIRLTPVDYFTGYREIQTGQVAAIHIETTHSRSVTFPPSDLPLLPRRTLQHKYHSEAYEELTAISWILNQSSECVRAEISESGNQRPQKLVPDQEPPLDQVQKLYFERQNNNDGKETIIAAEAYFQEWAIIGLVFIYSSQRRAGIDNVNAAATCQTINFAQDVRIVGLSVAGRENELMEIEFQVELNEQSGPRHKRTRLFDALCDVPADAKYYSWRKVWFKDERSAQGCKPILWRDRIYTPPGGVETNWSLRGLSRYHACWRYIRTQRTPGMKDDLTISRN